MIIHKNKYQIKLLLYLSEDLLKKDIDYFFEFLINIHDVYFEIII